LLVAAFGILSAFLSLFLTINNIKSFIEACKELRMFKNSNSLIEHNKIPMLNFTLKLDRLKHGIALNVHHEMPSIRLLGILLPK
jgi:hypothetical protein